MASPEFASGAEFGFGGSGDGRPRLIVTPEVSSSVAYD